MSRNARWFLLLVPPVLAVVAGWPSLRGAFIRDDVVYVARNPHVIGSASLAEILSAPFPPQGGLGLFRPVTTVSFRLDVLAGEALLGTGLHPEVHHATNLLLAAAAAAVLAALARKLGFGPWAAAGAAALFAAHAARTEAVCWISGRAEDLMTLGALASLLVAAGPPAAWRAPAAAALAVLAFWSKEQGIVLPLLVLLLPGIPGRLRLRRAAWCAGALALAALWRGCILGAIGPEGPQQVLEGTVPGERLAHGLAWLADYARLAVMPVGLINDYDDPAWPPSWLAVIAGAAVAVALLVLIRFRRERPAFALALFVLPLLPVLNVFYRTGETFAERFLALPIAGFALLAAFVPVVRMELFIRDRLSPVPLLVLLLAGNGFLSWKRAVEWKDEEELTQAHVRNAPRTGGASALQAHLLLREHPPSGTGLRTRPDVVLQTIRWHYERALELAPHLVRVRLDLAMHLKEMARPQRDGDPWDPALLARSESEARRATRDAPRLGEAHAILGEVLALQGRFADAEAALRRAIALDPADARTPAFLDAMLRAARR